MCWPESRDSVRVNKMGTRDRAALRVMIDNGEAELFASPLGPAYRLKRL